MSSINILLVDDEPKNLDALEVILNAPDYRLVRAANADEALFKLLQYEFAVIVLDIQMPGMTGIELAHLIKQRARTQHIPIIFLTAFYQDERRMLEGYSVGAVDYLSKPVNSDVLRSKVAVFVELQRKNRALAEEVAHRHKAEAALRDMNEVLEARVAERTAESQRALEQAERAGRAKDDFLAALSHELRTPLNPVLLIASEAAENPAFTPEVRDLFATIRKNVELESKLIDDLLDLTRITRGKMTLELKPADLHAIIEDAVETVRSEMEDKRISLSLEFSPARPLVSADPVRLQQVFWNLLKNAVKFTPAEGTVAIVTKCVSDSPTQVEVAVSDTGIGLSEAEIARIFDAFTQGDHARGGGTHRFGGLGLGLTISKSLVEHHGGSLRVESQGQGHGATFFVTLPLIEEPIPTPDAMPATPTGANSRRVVATDHFRSILLVEDHDPTRKTLETLLKRRGFSVSSSSTLDGARTLLRSHAFDLLISDIGLPDGSGFDLMREVRDATPIPGIALTGYGMEDDVGRSRDAGFDVHLTKPINVHALDSALQALAKAVDEAK